ncbi:hypothetical protein C8R48DRAFT_695804 [Suillus tomentosus]|nr:hypothetical protein C8R48DRAFT_695804 [Suillus tomentosus]
MDSRMPTLQNPPPDQYSTLQLILECIHRLDMLDRRLDMLDHSVREAMQEIRSVKDPVPNYQSSFTIEHSGGRDSTVDSQAGVNDLNPITSLGSLHDSQIMLQPCTGLLPYGARSSMHSGGRDSIVDSKAGLNSHNAIPPFMSLHEPYLVPQPYTGLSLNGARGFVNNVTHQCNIYTEGFPASYDMDGTGSSSEGMGARFGEFAIIASFSLRRLRCVHRFIDRCRWHVRSHA